MRIYFSGLGGIGIGPLALMSHDMGHEVVGSDKEHSRYTDIVTSTGIKIGFDQSGDYLKTLHQESPIDWYVYTSALPDDHPELQTARDLGVKTSKRDEFINHLINEHHLKLIAVSGTHGKTTTTAMIIWLFEQLQIPFAHMVGTNLSFAPSGRYQKKAQYLVYEADEFDRNMLRFMPDISVIPALDYDHPDSYPTIQSYQEAFKKFINQSQLTITWQSIAALLRVEAQDNVLAVPEDRNFASIKLAGQHNRANAWLAATALDRLVGDEVSWDKLLNSVSDFPGAERRFERLRDNLITDYAHHPTEIKATVEMAREVAGDNKVIVVYQPHQNRRQHEILNQYQNCFASADQLYWLPTYLSREEQSLDILTPEELVDKLTNKPPTQVANLDDELVGKIQTHLKNDDLVVIMGAGSVDAWVRDRFQ